MNRFSIVKILPNYVICFILFAIFFLGAIQIGPISIRNICIIILLIYIFLNTDKVTLGKNEKLYIMYLCILCICNIINGQIFEYIFIQNFLTYHVTCVFLTLSLPILVNSVEQIKFIVNFIIIIYLFNCFVSILQYYNLPIGWDVATFFNSGVNNIINNTDIISDQENFLSKSVVCGITGFVVANGYFSTIFLPIATNRLLKYNRSIYDIIIGTTILILATVTIFMIQQRMAFAILICFIIYLLFAWSNTTTKIILITIISIILIFTMDISFSGINMGRLTADNISSDPRMAQGQNFIHFFNSQYALWGADLDNALLANSLGHNTLMDSFRRGGIFTFIVYIILFSSILIVCIKTSIKSFKDRRHYTFCFALSCITFTIYSMTHSTGIQSGSVYFWVLYELMIISNNIEKSHYEQ